MDILGYKKFGRGENTVIVMHEWLGDHSNYNAALPYLDNERFEWVFVDLRGYGLSKDIMGQYTCKEAANDLKVLIQELGCQNVSMVGHSMSAMVAQRFALDNPELTKTLVLIAPVPASGIQLGQRDADILRAGVDDKAVLSNAINSRTGNRYNQQWLNYKLRLACNASSSESRLGYLDMFLNTNFSHEIKGLDIPVRVMVGKFDIAAFQKSTLSSLFSGWFSDFEIVECGESGHYPMLECPVYFASTLEKFILGCS